MENVEIVDNVEKVEEVVDTVKEVGETLQDVTSDITQAFLDGYSEGKGKGLIQGGGAIGLAWAGHSIYKNRKRIVSGVKGAFKKGKEAASEVEATIEPEKPVKR